MREDSSAILQRCRTRWPDLKVDSEAFSRHLRAFDGEAVSDRLHVEALYLCFACALGDPSALTALETEYLAELRKVIKAVQGSELFVDEVLQEVRTKLLLREAAGGRILQYRGRAKLASWLRAVALRTALSHRQKLLTEPAAAVAPEVLWNLPSHARDPELSALRREYRPSFEAGIRSGIALLSPKARNVLRCHYVDGLSLSQIGAVYRVDKSTVSRWLAESRRQILTSVRASVGRSLGLPPTDVESLLERFHSDLDDSLSSLLRAPDAAQEL